MMTLVTQSTESELANRRATARSAATLVPSLIQDAGNPAVESYLGFLAGRGLRGHKQASLPQASARLFLGWCREKGLSLLTIRGGHAQAFLEEMATQGYKHSTLTLYGLALKQLFAHFESDGVIADSPFRSFKSSTRGAKQRRQKVQELKQFLLELDGFKEGNQYYRPGLVAMYPIVIGGMDLPEIAETTGIGLAEVEEYAERLRANGIWTEDGKIAVDEGCEQDNAHMVVELVLIIGCAAGVFRKVPANDEGAVSEESPADTGGGDTATPNEMPQETP